jgi:large repetitive protein
VLALGGVALGGWALLGGLRQQHETAMPDPRQQRVHSASSDKPQVQQSRLSGIRLSTPAEAEPVAPVSVAGRVVNGAGKGIAQARVCTLSEKTAAGEEVCTATNAQGRFGFAVSPNTHALITSARGYEPRSTLLRNEDPVQVTLVAGGDTLAGQVLDVTGGPITGAWVRAGAVNTATAVDGTFALHVAAGNQLLSAGADGYGALERSVWAPSSGLRLVLSPASRVQGYVIAQDSLAPVAGVTVQVVGIAVAGVAASNAVSGQDGGFSLAGIAPGDYTVAASDSSWSSAEYPVTVALGQNLDSLQIKVTPAARLTALLNVHGEPCQQGAVQLSGPAQLFGQTNAPGAAAGAVELRGLLPGSYQVAVSCAGALPLAETLTVAGLGEFRQTWNLEAGLSVRGVVETPAGEPVRGTQVLLIPLGDEGPERPSAGCVSGVSGEFACAGLAAGDYECTLAHGQPESPVRVHLPQPPNSHLRLQARAVGTIVATLPPTALQDISQLGVFARDAEGLILRARPDAAGVLFDDVPLGSYEVAYEAAPTTSQAVMLRSAGEVLRVALAAPARADLQGRVIDETGLPVLDATVRAWASGSPGALLGPSSRSTLSDEHGAFVFSDVIVGSYDLDVTAPGGHEQLLAVETRSPGLVVRLKRQASLRVQVTTVQGESVEQFDVAYRQRGSNRADMATGQGGFWAAPPLPPATYTLSVVSEQGTATREIELAPNKTLDLQLQVTPTQSTTSAALLALSGATATETQ